MRFNIKDLAFEARLVGKNILRFLFDHHVYTKMRKRDFEFSSKRNAGRYVSITEDPDWKDIVILNIKLPPVGAV
jgi:hypothetical protein